MNVRLDLSLELVEEYPENPVEMWPPVTYTEGIPDRKHSGYIQYTYRGFNILSSKGRSVVHKSNPFVPSGVVL